MASGPDRPHSLPDASPPPPARSADGPESTSQDDALQRLAAIIARQQETIDGLQAALETLATRVAAPAPAAGAPASASAFDRTRLNGLETRLDRLREEVDDHSPRLVDLEGRVADLAGRLQRHREAAEPAPEREPPSAPRADAPDTVAPDIPRPALETLAGMVKGRIGSVLSGLSAAAAQDPAGAPGPTARAPGETADPLGAAFLYWCRETDGRSRTTREFEELLRRELGGPFVVMEGSRRYDTDAPTYDEEARTELAYWLVRDGDTAYLLPKPKRLRFNDVHPDSFDVPYPAPSIASVRSIRPARLRASDGAWTIAERGSVQ